VVTQELDKEIQSVKDCIKRSNTNTEKRNKQKPRKQKIRDTHNREFSYIMNETENKE
jgi:Lhr-like helicase